MFVLMSFKLLEVGDVVSVRRDGWLYEVVSIGAGVVYAESIDTTRRVNLYPEYAVYLMVA